jgi:ankyrin repeat protein
MDYENNQQDVSSLLSPWRNPYSKRRKGESDVEGCSSCGHGGGNSSDEEDPNFELIRNYDEVPEDDDNDADADDNDEVMEAADEDNDDDNDLESSCTDLHVSTTQLILRLGADPNATDFHGCTALHLLAKNRDNVAYSRVLMEYGAHIDQPDVYNSTPLMLFQEWQRNLVTRGNPDLNLQLLINHGLPLPLTCLAARVLSQNQIPFEKEKVPLTLHSFIQRH